MKSAVVIGSGPNGLAAAIRLAQAGLSVEVHEADRQIGGGASSAELTLPGFLHDRGSAIHPLALSSPYLKRLPLAKHGLRFVQPPIPLAHPLDGGRAVALLRSVEETASQFSTRNDRDWYRRLMTPLAQNWNALSEDVLRPLPGIPRHPVALAEFGLDALWPATMLVRRFRSPEPKALLGGNAAHSFLRLRSPLSSAFALILTAAGHAVGWPVPVGGSQKIADAMAGLLRSLGGTILTNSRIRSLQQVSGADVVMCDITPRQLLEIAGDQLQPSYTKGLRRYRPGPGIFKVDWALNSPIPWTSEFCRQAGTVHVCGDFGEIVASEDAIFTRQPSPKPFVLVAQQSLFDGSRAPAGKHTAWAYCHVPFNWQGFHLTAIERQIERFAPGFLDCILARTTSGPNDLVRWDENLAGGDIGVGLNNIKQFVMRPTWRQYGTTIPGVYLCSSSTPPGGGVHGMCGFWAAERALQSIA